MAIQSKHYFNIGFMKNITFCFKQIDNGHQSTKVEYIFHILISEWEKKFVVWSKES